MCSCPSIKYKLKITSPDMEQKRIIKALGFEDTLDEKKLKDDIIIKE